MYPLSGVGVRKIEAIALCISALKKLNCFIAKKRIGKNVLILLRPSGDLILKKIKSGGNEVRGTNKHECFSTADLGNELLRDRAGRSAVFTEKQRLELRSNLCVDIRTVIL